MLLGRQKEHVSFVYFPLAVCSRGVKVKETRQVLCFCICLAILFFGNASRFQKTRQAKIFLLRTFPSSFAGESKL